MKKHRLLILGMHAINSAVIAQTLSRKEAGVTMVVPKGSSKSFITEKIINSQFEPEPIMFHRMHFEFKPVKIEEPKRNKYFHKPRNNFKR